MGVIRHPQQRCLRAHRIHSIFCCSKYSTGSVAEALHPSNEGYDHIPGNEGYVSRGSEKPTLGNWEAVIGLDRLDRLDAALDSTSYASILRQCANCKGLSEGRRVHSHLVKIGRDQDTFLANLLVQMYGNCGNVDDARAVFDKIDNKNTFSWNIMVGACVQNGQEEEARRLFDSMPERDIVSWNAMISAYAQKGHLRDARSIFDRMEERNVVSWTTIVAGYAHKGDLLEARNLFDRMPQRNVVSWNAIISAYAQNGHGDEALQLFQNMDLEGMQPDKVTFMSVLEACGSIGTLGYGRMVDACVVEGGLLSDVMVATALVNMYGKCKSLDDAQRVFDDMPVRNVVSWNVMLVTYAQNGHLDEASSLFDRIPDKDSVSWNTMISVYTQKGYLGDARSTFEAMPKRDVISWTSMIASYAQSGNLGEACSMFEKMPQRNVVSWNSMLAAYSQNGHGKEALQLFKVMDLEGIQADNVSFVSVLDACADIEALAEGRIIHEDVKASALESDVVVASAIVNMYGKCGHLEDAVSMFEKMPQKNVVSWNTMVSAYGLTANVDQAVNTFERMPQRTSVSWTTMVVAYAQNGLLEEARSLFGGMPVRTLVSWNAMITAYAQNAQGKEAVQLFAIMDSEGLKPDKVTYVSILDACADIGALTEGKVIHESIAENGLESNLSVCTALFNMYGRCGSMEDARGLFDRMPEKDVISWTAIITAYAQCGRGQEGLELCQVMDLEGVQPNEITFISIISACSHAGLLDDGRSFFLSIYNTASIDPTLDHWICMIDLLGRAGQLQKAEELLSNMPFEPDAVAWRSLLGACRIHNDAERAARAAEHVYKLDPANAASYMLLSSIHAALGNLRKLAS